jgi:hypothetical protein
VHCLTATLRGTSWPLERVSADRVDSVTMGERAVESRAASTPRRVVLDILEASRLAACLYRRPRTVEEGHGADARERGSHPALAIIRKPLKTWVSCNE